LTDSYTGEQIDTSSPQDSFDISCDNGFTATNVENPYTAVNFGNGIVECTFSDLTTNAGKSRYFDKTQNITVTQNETIKISMSASNTLTPEEHDWLEAVYNCVIGGTGCA